MKRRQGQRGRKRLGREGLVGRCGRKVDPVPNATAFCITLKTYTVWGGGENRSARQAGRLWRSGVDTWPVVPRWNCLAEAVRGPFLICLKGSLEPCSGLRGDKCLDSRMYFYYKKSF